VHGGAALARKRGDAFHDGRLDPLALADVEREVGEALARVVGRLEIGNAARVARTRSTSRALRRARTSIVTLPMTSPP
jgi:hypothetical protein